MIIVLLTRLVNGSSHTRFVSLDNEKFNLVLLIYIPMYAIKIYTVIQLRLIDIDVLEVLKLLLTYLTKYVLQIKQII